MNMNNVAKSVHLDVARLTPNGLTGVILPVAIPIVYTVLFSVVEPISASDSASSMFTGATFGMVVALVVMSTAYPFIYEDTNGHRKINGIIPVSRTGQIAGRYLVSGVVDLIGMVVLVVCLGIVSVRSQPMTFQDIVTILGLMLVVSILLESVVIPVMYRFTSAKTFQYMMFGGFGVAVLIAGLGFLLDKIGWLDPLAAVFSRLLSSVPLTVLAAVILLVVAVAVSFAASNRIYQRKEL